MTNTDIIRLSIYEAWNDNKITNEEKDFLFEKLETMLMDKKLFGKMTLYHCSDKKDLTVVKPNSINIGTNLSHVRMSSFWSNNVENAYMWAAELLIGYINHVLFQSNVIKFKMRFSEKKIYVKEIKEIPGISGKNHDASKLMDFALSKQPIYMYTAKDVPIFKIGRGHADVDEYTTDKPVKIDKKEKLNIGTIMSVVKIVGAKEFNSVQDEVWGKERGEAKPSKIFRNPDGVGRARNYLYQKAELQRMYGMGNPMTKDGDVNLPAVLKSI